MRAVSNRTHERTEPASKPAPGIRNATACEMVEQAMTADDTCLSGLIKQPLEARTAEHHDDEPSHTRTSEEEASVMMARHEARANVIAIEFGENKTP